MLAHMLGNVRRWTKRRSAVGGSDQGAAVATRRELGRVLECMELEDRIVLSGSPIAKQTDVTATAPHPAPGANVVLIDTQLTNYSLLARAAAPGSKIFLYDGATESANEVLGEVQNWATSTHSQIQNLSIMSHGVGGAFELGDQWISATALPQTAAAWQQLSTVLTAGADIDLFGCNVSQSGSTGQTLLNQLASLTGAQVFASNNPTGQGGDWKLEAASTNGQAQLASGLAIPFNTQLLNRYTGTLTTIAIDSTSSASVAAAANSLTFSQTVNSGSNGLLVVEVALNNAGTTVSSVTYGGTSLTYLDSAVQVMMDTEIWYLVAPTVGTANVVVTTTGGSPEITAGATSFFGVKQATPFGAPVTVSGNGGNPVMPSLTVASATSDLVLAAAGVHFGTSDTPGGGQTELWNQVGAATWGGADTAPGASSVTISWSVPVSAGAKEYAAVGVDIQASPNSPPVNTVPGAQTVNDISTLVFNSANSNLISVSDASAIGTSDQIALSVASGTLTLGSTTGLTFDAGSNGSASMTIQGTLADLNAALDGLTYTPPANLTNNASDTLTMVTTDTGDALSHTSTVGITIHHVNRAPVNTVPGAQTVNDNATLVFNSANSNLISVADSDANGNTEQVALSIGSGTLTLSGTTGLTFTAGANGSASMTVRGTIANLNAALDGLTYTPPANLTNNGSATLTLATDDMGHTGSGGPLTTTSTVSITIDHVDLAPTITVPGAQTASENTALILSAGNGNRISVADSDSNGSPEQVSLTITNGTISLSGTTGLTFGSGTGTNDTSMQFTGTLTDINNALNGLTYNPTANFFGAAGLGITINDLGNTGVGGPQSAGAGVGITVGHVNAAPANTVPGPQTTNENTALLFSAGNANQISVSDAAAGSNSLLETLTATSGTLTLGGTTGLTFSSGTGTGDATMSFTGTITDINNALNGLSFQPTNNYSGAASVQIASTDYTGSGGPQTANNTVNVTVNHVNATPVNTVPGPRNINENATLVFSSGNGNQISVSDPAAGGNPLQETLTAANGTLTLNGTTGLTFTSGTGAGDATMTFTGTITNINNALNGLSYQPTSNYFGSASLQIASTDYTGSGGPQTASSTVGITVEATGFMVPGTPITIDTTSSGTTGNGGAASLTFSHTVNNGADDILLVEVAGTHGNAGDPVSSVTYGGQSLTYLGAANLPNDTFSDIWYLLAPSAGTANVVVTTAGSQHFVAGATDYFGVDQTTPLGTLATATGSSSTPSVTLASMAGQLVVDSLGTRGDAGWITPTGPGQTEVWSQSTGGAAGDGLGGSSYQPGAASVTMSWSEGNNEHWTLAAIGLNPNPAPTIAAPASASSDENASLVFSSGGGNGISITDYYAAGTEQASLSVTSGSLTLSGTTGLTFTAGGNGTATMTIQGTLSDINTALDGLTYTPTVNYFGSDSLAIAYNDLGDAKTANDSVALTVNHVNTTPVNTVPGPQSANENTALDFSSAGGNQISVSDPAAGSNPLQETLTATNGTLTLSSTTGLTFTTGTGAGDTTMTFTGTLTDINNALDGLSFQPTSNYFGAASVQIASTDYTGSGGPQTAANTVNVTVNHVNAAPVNTVPGPQSTNENAALSFSAVGANQISVSDAATGSNPLQETLTATNGTLTLSGTTGLTFTSGTGAGDTTMTFTGTITDINNALDGLSFQPTNNYFGAASVQIASTDYTGSGGPQTATNTVNVTVNHVNATPVNTVPGPQTASENTALVFSSGNGNPISVSDPAADNNPLQETLIATNGTLTLNSTTGLTFSVGTGAGDAAMTFTGTLTDINNALDGLSFQPTNNYFGAASVQIASTDYTGSGGPQTATDTVNITVNHVNTAPVNTVPGPQATNENTPLAFSSAGGNQISVSDLAAANNPLQETLSASNGTLTLSDTTGLTFISGTGAGDTTMTFTGTITDINNALDGLSFQPGNNYSGAASVQIASTDYTGTGVPQTATNTVNVTVNHVNATPVNTVPGPQTTNENTPVVFSSAGGDPISVSDPAAGSLPLQETLTATNGTLTLNGTTGLTFTSGTGAGDTTMTVTGTLTDINNALDGLSFQPTSNYSGAAGLQITSTDYTGSGGPQSASDAVGITVNHVNATPAINIPAAQTTQGTSVAFSTGNANPISIADATAGNAPLQITLSATNGNITLNSTAGLTFSAGTGTGDATMTFTGTLASINAALNGMNLQLSSNSAQLLITASDSSGLGGPTSATAGVSVQKMLPPLPPTPSPPVTGPPISNPGAPPSPPPPSLVTPPTPPQTSGAKASGEAPASSQTAPSPGQSASNSAPPVLVTAGNSNSNGDNWVFTAIASAAPSHGLKPTVRAAAPGALAASFESVLPWNQLDSVAKQLSSPLGSVELDKVGGAAALFTAGYVFWFMRGGALLASMVSSLPAWQSYDPLPILDFADKKHHDGLDGEDESDLPAAAARRPARRAKDKNQGGRSPTTGPHNPR